MTRLGPLSMVFIVFLLIALVNAVRSVTCGWRSRNQENVGFAGVIILNVDVLDGHVRVGRWLPTPQTASCQCCCYRR